jgi:hypothetical protein
MEDSVKKTTESEKINKSSQELFVIDFQICIFAQNHRTIEPELNLKRLKNKLLAFICVNVNILKVELFL